MYPQEKPILGQLLALNLNHRLALIEELIVGDKKQDVSLLTDFLQRTSPFTGSEFAIPGLKYHSVEYQQILKQSEKK